MKRIISLLSVTILSLFLYEKADALPAFAIREHVTCMMCHTNGSYPHLTRAGFMYRRAGFRFPSDIGNDEKDNSIETMAKHLATGANIDYQNVSTTTGTAKTANITNDDVNVREVEIWPLIGAFHGNLAVWSEVDFAPGTDGTAASAALNQGDIRYVWGQADKFYGLRAGLIAPEGFGASDQWLDDGNIPLFETSSARFNQDTLATPFGAMDAPQMGFELTHNTDVSFVTLGILNGFSGSSGSATPAGRKNVKDYKIQWDQFITEKFSMTAAYYFGNISLATVDSTGSTWANQFQNSRLYLTYAPNNNLEILGGLAYGDYQYVTVSSGVIPVGRFQNRGAFGGFIYHIKNHLSLGVRYDYATLADSFSDVSNSTPMNRGFGVMVSVPFEHSNIIFHLMQNDTNSYYVTSTDPTSHTAQSILDFRTEWRFLF